MIFTWHSFGKQDNQQVNLLVKRLHTFTHVQKVPNWKEIYQHFSFKQMRDWGAGGSELVKINLAVRF